MLPSGVTMRVKRRVSRTTQGDTKKRRTKEEKTKQKKEEANKTITTPTRITTNGGK